MKKHAYEQEVNKLIENMQTHSAWFGDITGNEAEKILKSYPVNSYLLRTGESDLHYFFTYMSKEGLVFHKSIRINAELVGYYANGGTGCNPNKIHNSVEDLIAKFLGCEESELCALTNSLTQAQGF